MVNENKIETKRSKVKATENQSRYIIEVFRASPNKKGAVSLPLRDSSKNDNISIQVRGAC